MKTKILILSIAAALPSAWICAQAADAPPRAPRDGERPRGEGPRDGERPRGEGPRDGERPRGDGPRDGEPPRGPMPMPFLHALDADEDGIISANEIKNAPEALKKLDRNKDGQLTHEEWQPMPPRPPQGDGERPRGDRPRDGERPPRGERPRDGEAKAEEKKPTDKPAGERQTQRRPQGPPPPLLEALDTDRDGTISKDEIEKSSESLAKLDQNMDGQLGPREYGPRPPQGPPPREGGRDGEKPAAQ